MNTPRTSHQWPIALLFAATCLVAGSAHAQDRVYGAGEDEPAISMGAFTALNTERVYLVQPGDTLWDLSGAFYYDEWMWPTLWALNPQITNPHWIYPGDMLFIQPQASAAPATSLTLLDSRYNDAPRNLILPVRNMGFIGQEEYQESGVINYSREEREMLGQYDEVYLKLSTARTVRPQEELTIYRIDRDIEHPETGDDVGYLVRFLGIVRVLDTSKPLVKGVIVKSFEEMKRGDLVTEIFQHTRMVQPVQNTIEQDAIILATFEEHTLTGELQYVFVDKGTQHKVRTGNRFVILERGDPFIEEHPDLSYDEDEDVEDLPWERTGELVVVEPYENHSLCIVSRSIHELKAGMKLRMLDRY